MMIKVVDVVYYCHKEYDQPQQVLDKHSPSIGFVELIKDRINYALVRHLNYEGKKTVNGVLYAFFKRNNAAWQIPIRTHNYIRSLKPDLVIIHGFIFPLQVIALRMSLGKKCVLVLQHHGDKPADSVRKIFQRIADRFVSAYLFTSAEIAKPWLDHRIIRNRNKIFELLEASAFVEKKDKPACKQKLGLTGRSNFLWVARLNENKDPATVLKAFAKYVSVNRAAKLFMIYQEDQLLATVKKIISNNDHLHTNVHLVGKLAQTELTDWYNAADFYISGSHNEAAGYALLEAMSVGCIPVVTSIPAFKKILGNGQVGFMFQPADVNGLENLLHDLGTIDVDQHAAAVEKYFHENQGFKNIADGMFEICNKLIRIK